MCSRLPMASVMPASGYASHSRRAGEDRSGRALGHCKRPHTSRLLFCAVDHREDDKTTVIAPDYTVDLGDRASAIATSTWVGQSVSSSHASHAGPLCARLRILHQRRPSLCGCRGRARAFPISSGRRLRQMYAASPARMRMKAAAVRSIAIQSVLARRLKSAENKAYDEKAMSSYFEAAFSDALAIYMLSITIDFDYYDLREREYPLLAAPALAERCATSPASSRRIRLRI